MKRDLCNSQVQAEILYCAFKIISLKDRYDYYSNNSSRVSGTVGINESRVISNSPTK